MDSKLSSYQDWHIPFARADITLQMALDSLSEARAEGYVESSDDRLDSPLMVKLAEAQKLSSASLQVFSGTIDLFQHDCIQILLGRGLHDMDEAYTAGFTMGSSKKVTDSEHSLHAFIAKHIYPNVYKFTDQEIAIFKDAIKISYISNCSPLDQFKFDDWLDQAVGTIRDAVGIESELILAYYAVEKRKYPQSVASQRLLPEKLKVVTY